MSALSVGLGSEARAAFCDAFDAAASSIDAEFFSVSDPLVIASLNRAAERGVHVRITLEGDTHRFGGHRHEPADAAVRGALSRRIDVVISRAPHSLVHGKAAVVDNSVALVATANPTVSGFEAAGAVVVTDRNEDDVRAVDAEIDAAARGRRRTFVLRRELGTLMRSPFDLRIASEDLSDPKIAAWLLHRARAGHVDRVLVGPHQSRAGREQLRRLVAAGVHVRTYAFGYMHEKFIDAGDRIYVGSANLTRNGIDEAYEAGVVADVTDFDDGGAALRADFDARWSAQTQALGRRERQVRRLF